MNIHVIGARAENPVDDPAIKLFSSITIKTRDDAIQIDAGNPRKASKVKPSLVLITHTHPDHIKCIDEYKDIAVAACKPIWDKLKKEEFTRPILLKPKSVLRWGTLQITPFPVIHSKLAPTFGFTIKCSNNPTNDNNKVKDNGSSNNSSEILTYIPDIAKFSPTVEEQIKRSNILFFDGSTYSRDVGKPEEGYGHIALKKSIPKLRTLGVKKLFIIHIGKETARRKKELIDFVKQKIRTVLICRDDLWINTRSDLLSNQTNHFNQSSLSRKYVGYDPAKSTNVELIQDHKTCHIWYYKKQASKPVPVSLEDIINFHILIVREMKKRGISHYMRDELDRKTISKLTKSSNDILNELTDFTLFKNLISLVGSTAEKGKGNDIDILIRLKTPPEEMKRAIETRISKVLPNENLHFIWGDEVGPHDTHYPLYDLKLVRVKPERVEMSTSVKLLVPFIPQKPHGSAYYSKDELTKLVDKFKPEDKAYIEKKYDGFHVTVHKQLKEGKVKIAIYTEQRKDITKAFPTLVKEIAGISKDEFIIDGELVPYKDNKALGRNELMRFLGIVRTGNEIDDSHIRLHIWDIVYFNKSITDLPLSSRKEMLDKLTFSKRITKVTGTLVEKDKIISKVEAVRKLPDSEGAIIKIANATYSFGERGRAWFKFRNLHDVVGVIVKKVPKKGDVFNYLVGIHVKKDETDDRYVIQHNKKNVLVLGHTFNTKEEVSEGKLIDIKLEEVWRHESKFGIRYSIHKPRFIGISEKNTTSTIKDLEDIVVSVGVAIKHSLTEDEGREESEITDFPDRLQSNLKQVMDKGLELPFVMQHHERGNSLHTDVRLFVPREFDKLKEQSKISYSEKLPLGHLEGFTIFSPPSIDKPDEVDNQAKSVRCTIKKIGPPEWLKVEGITKAGEAGGTVKLPGIFTIVSHGTYTIWKVEDHSIGIRFNCNSFKIKKVESRKRTEPDTSKNLKGNFVFTINHIGDRYLMFFSKVKD